MKTITDHLEELKEAIQTAFPQFEAGGYVAIEALNKYSFVSINQNEKIRLNFNDKLGHYFYLRAWDIIDYPYSENQISACGQTYDWNTEVKLVFYAPKFNTYNIEALVSNFLLKNSKIGEMTIKINSCYLDKYKIYFEETGDDNIPKLDNIALVMFNLSVSGLKELIKDECIDLKFCTEC